MPIAFSFAVLDLTGSASALGLVLAVGFGSRIALMLVGGLVADRLPRKRVMIGADAARACTQAAVATLFLLGEAKLWELLVLFMLYGAADAFFSPGLDRDRGLDGRSRRASVCERPSERFSKRRHPSSARRSAGLLVATAPIGAVFAIDAGLVPRLGCRAAGAPGSGPSRPLARSRGLLADLGSGWHELRCRTWLWSSIVFFGLSNLALAPFYVLGPLVARDALGGADRLGTDHGVHRRGIAGRRRSGARCPPSACAHVRVSRPVNLRAGACTDRRAPSRSGDLRLRRDRVRRDELLQHDVADDDPRTGAEAAPLPGQLI